MKIWMPKKLDKCIICKCNQAPTRLIIVEWQSWCYEHGFEDQLQHLCHWCYDTLMTYAEPITLQYIEEKHKVPEDETVDKDNYRDYCEKYVGQYYLTEEIMKALTRCIIYDNHITTRPDPKYKVMCDIVIERLKIADTFLIKRNEKLRHIQHLNSICAINTLHHDKTSYFYLLPRDMLNLITSFV